MKSWKKLALSGVSMLTVGALAACGASSTDSDDSTEGGSDQVTLQMYQIGDRPENYDVLMGEANEIIEEEIGVNVNINYIPELFILPETLT